MTDSNSKMLTAEDATDYFNNWKLLIINKKLNCYKKGELES